MTLLSYYLRRMITDLADLQLNEQTNKIKYLIEHIVSRIKYQSSVIKQEQTKIRAINLKMCIT
jgi:hypothetical protein